MIVPRRKKHGKRVRKNAKSAQEKGEREKEKEEVPVFRPVRDQKKGTVRNTLEVERKKPTTSTVKGSALNKGEKRNRTQPEKKPGWHLVTRRTHQKIQ